jgi:hypothetical protein
MNPAIPDVQAVTATLRFDVTARQAAASASVDLVIEGPAAYPALDLRQEPSQVRLDGVELDGDAFPRIELGGMRIVDRLLAGRHRLEVDYALRTPDAVGAEPVGWGDGGVRFDLWMSDLEPGRYLEQWVPAPLCHDRFALTLDVEVVGTDRPHVVVTNAAEEALGANRWRLRYPASFTSLSPMLVVAPADEVVGWAGRAEAVEVRMWRHAEVDADLEACGADVVSWLGYLAARYGPWVHGERFTGFVWSSTRGMEYDGATTASVGALEHEVFHSWFGRGVKPATASDGWIDEAWTSWATVSGRSALARFAELPVEEVMADPPTVLCPPDPWSRYTPREAYGQGARLFAAVATMVGGPARLRSAMAALYLQSAGGFVSTEGLRRHLEGWAGVDLGPLWDRIVHGAH